MSSFDWAERVQRERAFDATELGKAFRRFENLHGRAWQTDSNDRVSDKRLKEVWAASNSAREELLKLLIRSVGCSDGACQQIQSSPQGRGSSMQYRIEFKTSFDRSFTHMVHSDDVQSAKITASALRHDDKHIFDVKLMRFVVGKEKPIPVGFV